MPFTKSVIRRLPKTILIGRWTPLWLPQHGSGMRAIPLQRESVIAYFAGSHRS